VDPPSQTNLPPINLKDPALAAFLAWLVPGLGHWYQGRRAKAVLFFVCIMGLFTFGLWLGGTNQTCKAGNNEIKIGYGRAVYYSWQPTDRRWHFFCQLGIGLPALPALIQASRMGNGQQVHWGGFMAPPWPSKDLREDVRCNKPNAPNLDQPTPHEINLLLGRDFELAGVFTMIAGLLNILAIYDAFAGPVPPPPPDEKDDKNKKKGKIPDAMETT
jgi:hypothetical protein